MSAAATTSLDRRIAACAARDLPLAAAILREAIRLPADWVDRPAADGGDPECGLSNHEGPRLEYLRRMLVEIGGVASPEDCLFDRFGNLEWTLEDRADGVPRHEKRVVLLDGHCDTVRALRAQWLEKAGVDPYLGITDPARVHRDFLRRELGWVPPDDEWGHLVFGRGAADQLGGVVAQLVASRILLELRDEGALRGVIVRGYVTVAEEDNDGGGPMFLSTRLFPGAPPEFLPDAVVLTDSTGDARLGALGIYRGQRGRMQIEVEVTGRSCHGSMPWEGLNPLEWGAAMLAEAARRHDEGTGFLSDGFLGPGTRTASWAHLDTPSDCAVPERFVFRFDRRLTVGESPERALADVEALDAVRAARAAGLTVAVRVPVYDRPTWRGYVPGNPQIYRGWATPEDHPVIAAAVDAYRAAVSPFVADGPQEGGRVRREPRVGRWIFSTDGVGFPVPAAGSGIDVPARKRWVVAGGQTHAAMFGFGVGIEQNTHKIGECSDLRELGHAIAFLARFPSALVARG
uniref:Peptidase M20 dimerisation domain-containing protein n=1 Tax=Eiseniibacteriota bacterium TaxID=2212470 RepID=A0A832I3A7_UNCEI